jgi:integrase
MEASRKIPELMRMMFGEQAYTMRATAGERLVRWAEAFEAWLGEREANYGRSTRSMAQVGWRELLALRCKAPWEVEESDVLAFEKELEKRQLRPASINQRITALSKFYDFCATHGVDPEWSSQPGCNPAKRVPRRKERKYDQAHYLSREEAQALLGAIDRDESALGKRDYALALGVLEAGMRIGELRSLRWGEIQAEEGGNPASPPYQGGSETHAGEERGNPADLAGEGEAVTPDPSPILGEGKMGGNLPYPPYQGGWAALGEGQRRVRLPERAWEAIQEYLRAAGRWGKMRAEAFIFAPLASPLEEGLGEKAEDWAEDRPMTMALAKFVLKRYARAAGLKPELVTWTSLRHTAAMLRVDAGDEAEAINEFLGRENVEKTRAYIEKLIDQERKSSWDENGPGEAIQRGPNRAQPGNQQALKHGFYANRKAEGGKEGLEAEIAYFRQIMARVSEMLDEPMEASEFMRLVDVYGMAITRLGNLMKTQKKLGEGSLENTIAEALREVAVELKL